MQSNFNAGFNHQVEACQPNPLSFHSNIFTLSKIYRKMKYFHFAAKYFYRKRKYIHYARNTFTEKKKYFHSAGNTFKEKGNVFTLREILLQTKMIFFRKLYIFFLKKETNLCSKLICFFITEQKFLEFPRRARKCLY